MDLSKLYNLYPTSQSHIPYPTTFAEPVYLLQVRRKAAYADKKPDSVNMKIIQQIGAGTRPRLR